MNRQVSTLPLDGIRVIDLVRGPMQGVGKNLADLGAEVIVVEPPAGSPARGDRPADPERGLSFAVLNRGKRSLVADPSTAEGQRQLDALLTTADLCLVDYADDATDPFLDPRRLRATYRHLAVVSLTDFGREGDRSAWKATPDVHSALSTLLSRSGLPSMAEPLLPPEFLVNGAASAQALFAALAALYQSLRTGSGEYVDFSVSEALMHVVDPPFGMGGTAQAGRSVTELPRGRPDASYMYPIFRVLDGWVRICVLSPRQWAGMFEWLGRPARFAHDRYRDTLTRFTDSTQLHALIAELFAGMTREKVTELGHGFGVPIAPVLSAAEVLQTEHFRAAGSIGLLAGTSFGDSPVLAPTGVFDLDGVHVTAGRPAPELDEAHGLAEAPPLQPRRVIPGDGLLPLAGVRVLDLGVIVMGGELGRLLADLGAEVIKIESRSFPDGSRLAADMSESFAWGHRNKKSMGLNLRSPRGQAAFRDLVALSDVLLANFKPGTLQKLGFGYDVLSEINPAIILSESSAFGNRGPWSDRMGYGPLVRAVTGLSSLWRYPGTDEGFSDAITIYPDHAVARLNAAGVLALLIRRATTGLGGSVSTAQVDAILDGMAVDIARESIEPGSLVARGNRRAARGLRGLFACAGDDEWVVIDAFDEATCASLARAVGHPEWSADTTSWRRWGEDVRAEVEAWTRSMTAPEVTRLLQARGVPAGEMVRPPELLADEHLRRRGFFGELVQPQLAGPLPAYTAETSFETIPDPAIGAAPTQAQHTREIAESLLGWTPGEIAEALVEGTLEAPVLSPLKEQPMIPIPIEQPSVPVFPTGEVLAELRGHVLLVTINRPDARNAVNIAVARAIGELLDWADRSPAVWVVILTGSGERSFCAGQDLKEAAAGAFWDDEDARRWGFAGYATHAISKPTIAAVNGFALGGGTELVLASDLAVAADTATFGLPEVKRGLIAAAGGTFRLPRQVPSKLAMESILTGRSMSAERAREVGLVNRVVPLGTLLDEAFALADEIMQNAPLSVQASKRIARGIDDGAYATEDSDWARTHRESRLVMTTADAAEGLSAFAEKRAPQWVAG
jgi:crotonobetainyl-CoA:carnitine CoA-transferase CaiB-like acyl-CoA transferase/enoyl-CoA hydratase/carnithine racemase